MTIDIVCASHRHDILKSNLLNNNWIRDHANVHIMIGFDSVPKAYNAAKITSDLVVYVHEDVKLGDDFLDRLHRQLKLVPDDFGVLGCAGVELLNGKRIFHGNILDRGKQWGSAYDLPHPVDTLDELLLITKGKKHFDITFPLDFYGADICMGYKATGVKNYALNLYVEHNSTRTFGGRTDSFYNSQKLFTEKWKDYLPIGTTCALIK